MQNRTKQKRLQKQKQTQSVEYEEPAYRSALSNGIGPALEANNKQCII